MKISILLLLFTLFLSGTPPEKVKDGKPNIRGGDPYPRHVILMVGGGMGIAQITAGMYANGNRSNLENFPVVGLHKAYASNELINDSASGATALACGVKTYNGAVGVNRDSLPVQSLFEQAKGRDMATGIVTTTSLTHPSIAAFFAHVKFSSMTEKIINDFLDAEVGLFIGGGEREFSAANNGGHSPLEELEKKGYSISGHSKQELSDLFPSEQKKLVYFTAEEEPVPAAEGRNYLASSAEMAASFLKGQNKKNGFLLLIENPQISNGSQENNSDTIVSEMIDFDKAIGKVLEFAQQDGQTLVIVTGDHEAGGFAINPGSAKNALVPAFTTNEPTASLVPVFAYGPGAELFRGIYNNTEIHARIKRALRWTGGN